MSDYEMKRYKRIHKYSNPSDIEKGKIKKEKTNYVKYRKETDKVTQKILKNIDSIHDIEDELLDEFEEYNLKAEKEVKNAKTHKKRLNKLDKNKDFY